MRSLLSQSKLMLRAEIAEITLFPESPDEPAYRTYEGVEGDMVFMQPVDLDPKQGIWARVASEQQAVLVPRPIQNERLRAHFADRGMRDAIVAPLHGEQGVIGTFSVGSRLGDVSTFDMEDLKLFETLSNNAGISLQNARLVGKLQKSLAELTEMNRLKDDFVATVSHELRTPLTSIQGYVKTLLRPDVEFSEPDRRSFLQIVDRQSVRLGRLIEDLLIVSRIESKDASPDVTEFAMAEILHHVIDELVTKTKGRQVAARVDQDLPLIHSDQGKVHQVMLNLIDNALKYSPTDASVMVRVASQADGVVVLVEDRGHGIDPDLQDKIFERFYQVDQTSTRKVGGAGLGLYICKQLAEAVGGRLWLERSSEEGSVFGFWIPVSATVGPIDEPTPHPTHVV
jgi:signal transduction histidine kinase